jgi:hypothetical protein
MDMINVEEGGKRWSCSASARSKGTLVRELATASRKQMGCARQMKM